MNKEKWTIIVIVVCIVSVLVFSVLKTRKISEKEQINLDQSSLDQSNYVSGDIKLKDGRTISEKEIQEYEKTHNEKNGGRKYILSLLLDKYYPLTAEEANTLLTGFITEEGESKVESYKKREKLSDDDLKEELKYIEQFNKYISDSLEITDEKLEEHYESWVPPLVIQHILVEDETLALTIVESLTKGEEFDDLVEKYSVDTDTKENKGYWNYKKGSSISSFENQLDQLGQVGDISSPFKTIMGWHIVKLIQTSERGSLSEVKEEVKASYIQNQFTQNYKIEMENKLLEENILVLTKENKKALGIIDNSLE